MKGGSSARRPPASASATPTAKNPNGSIAKTATSEASTSASGAIQAGATSPRIAASSGGLRRTKVPVRSRTPVPAFVPNAAPTPKTPTSSAGPWISAS